MKTIIRPTIFKPSEALFSSPKLKYFFTNLLASSTTQAPTSAIEEPIIFSHILLTSCCPRVVSQSGTDLERDKFFKFICPNEDVPVWTNKKATSSPKDEIARVTTLIYKSKFAYFYLNTLNAC